LTIALVLGGGSDVFRDVERALRLGEFDAVVACNDVVVDWPGQVDIAVSLHAEKWPYWLRKRKTLGRSSPKRIFGHANFSRSLLHIDIPIEYSNHLYEGQTGSGSSGHFALKVALENYDRAVCCGIPMDSLNHYFDKRGWGGAPNHRRGWLQSKYHLDGRAKSMGGWTAELLGKPRKEWILEGYNKPG
jgi:hypothetical protein